MRLSEMSDDDLQAEIETLAHQVAKTGLEAKKAYRVYEALKNRCDAETRDLAKLMHEKQQRSLHAKT